MFPTLFFDIRRSSNSLQDDSHDTIRASASLHLCFEDYNSEWGKLSTDPVDALHQSAECSDVFGYGTTFGEGSLGDSLRDDHRPFRQRGGGDSGSELSFHRAVPHDPFKMSPQDPFRTSPSDPFRRSPLDPFRISPLDPFRRSPLDPYRSSPINFFDPFSRTNSFGPYSHTSPMEPLSRASIIDSSNRPNLRDSSAASRSDSPSCWWGRSPADAVDPFADPFSHRSNLRFSGRLWGDSPLKAEMSTHSWASLPGGPESESEPEPESETEIESESESEPAPEGRGGKGKGKGDHDEHKGPALSMKQAARFYALQLLLQQYLPLSKPAAMAQEDWQRLSKLCAENKLVELVEIRPNNILVIRLLELYDCLIHAIVNHGHGVAQATRDSSTLFRWWTDSDTDSEVFSKVLNYHRHANITERVIAFQPGSLDLTDPFFQEHQRRQRPLVILQQASVYFEILLSLFLHPDDFHRAQSFGFAKFRGHCLAPPLPSPHCIDRASITFRSRLLLLMDRHRSSARQ